MAEPAGPNTAGQNTAGTLSWRALWAETTVATGDRQRARWLCETAAGCSGAEFLAELDSPATVRMVAHLDAMLARLAVGEPLQYVLGSWQFRHLDLMVDRRVLIPRPETEWVCATAIALARTMSPPLRFADLGTGSGAIGLALASELGAAVAEMWLVDNSAEALDVARANTAGIGSAGAVVRTAHGCWFDALPPSLRDGLDVVVANPPYIADGDPAVEESVAAWEPHGALFAGPDGMRDLAEIVAGAPGWLRPGGALVLEFGSTQGPAVRDLLERAGFIDIAISRDPAGHDRIAVGRRE